MDVLLVEKIVVLYNIIMYLHVKFFAKSISTWIVFELFCNLWFTVACLSFPHVAQLCGRVIDLSKLVTEQMVGFVILLVNVSFRKQKLLI